MYNKEEKDLLEEIPIGKVYSQKQIVIGTLIGGLLVAAYLLSANFKVFNERSKVGATWVIFVMVGILFSLSSLVPGLERLPNIVFIILGAVIVSAVFSMYQSKKVQAHIEKDGQVQPTGKLVLVILVGVAIIVSISLTAFALQDSIG